MGNTEKATFAGGCFWGVEAAFREIPGVTSTAVGYAGGSHPDPTYQDVCSGTTGHSEALEVEFDPEHVSYGELLDRFWDIHDPTQLNRQGPDVGSQYRSMIFFHSPEQEAEALLSKRERQSQTRGEIVTEIVPASDFHRAEEYHQRYFEKQGRASCTPALRAS
jgi:peptide-methionine (S)-S-oxide reductase